ncbi:hypothetical protein NEUTE1DRAFT_127012 [Neurospora tetrasperma FGSC 2508]|uniref:Uncharacterized protein n=1 Tax=Neurospora tetrasperma (strain FGSC 2508 / ATCC MYA-4615 / P0657) TaxID=510951 RepID=F8N0G7_NEUT8|nr:uncharacterized protein NEUTE1DRAFT_127012 [Neurospora tetrasperma FGSC 2508]EGO53795.1 hypothetical protein NEUTE1DRAFT_127012 [Neurospora tetrasperma FGSC 2508]EGZ76122.1 hypothetical protein NEUTE2DRAFT_97697 [Neurospora tetrasperma FGSC 2509]
MANHPFHRRVFNGSADFQRDDCPGPCHPGEYLNRQPSYPEVGQVTEDFNQYPLGIPNATEHLFGLDQSSSGTRDITEEFFDWDLWSKQDEVTVTTETSIEGDSLVRSAPSATQDQDTRMTLDHESETTEGTVIVATSSPLAIPFLNQPTRGENLDPKRYPTSEDIDIHLSEPDSHDADETQASSRSRLGKQTAKRERILSNPEETARTRENRACLSCKIQKTRAWGNAKRTALLISHCTNAGNAILLVHGCEFIESGPDLRSYYMVGIAPDEGPSDKDLYDWGKRDVEAHADTEENFPNCLEKFLLLYEQMFHQRYVANVKSSDQTRPGKFHKLMDNAQYVACMARIWTARRFSVSGVPFGFDPEPVSVFLRQRAGKVIGPIEGQILELLKAFSTSTETKITKAFSNSQETKITPDLESTMGSALVIAVWTALWQMMLTYRSVLNLTPPGTAFHEETNELFQSMVTIYSRLFRTAEVLRTVEKAFDSADAFDNGQVRQAFRKAWGTRLDFYCELKNGPSSNSQDTLLKTHVVTWEELVLNRRSNEGKGKVCEKKQA